jgi:hypothetical protein
MAERKVFRIMAMEQGWCCAHGCLSIENIKARGKGQRGIPPTFFLRFGMEPKSGSNVLVKWRQGGYRCEKLSNCLLAAVGMGDDDIPDLSPSHREFLSLKGRTFKAYKAECEPIRKGESLRAVVMRQSGFDWLWIEISLPTPDPEIKLGDPMWLDNLLWGTVIDIDGPTIILLLPGPRHNLRSNKIFRTNNPS